MPGRVGVSYSWPPGKGNLIPYGGGSAGCRIRRSTGSVGGDGTIAAGRAAADRSRPTAGRQPPPTAETIGRDQTRDTAGLVFYMKWCTGNALMCIMEMKMITVKKKTLDVRSPASSHQSDIWSTLYVK